MDIVIQSKQGKKIKASARLAAGHKLLLFESSAVVGFCSSEENG
jgi:hypothetical protein